VRLHAWKKAMRPNEDVETRNTAPVTYDAAQFAKQRNLKGLTEM
jgi:hypothetical protein